MASLTLPLAAPVLLSVAAAHAARAFLASGSSLLPFLAAALVAPAALLVGVLVPPGGSWQVPSLALATVSLPALGVWAAARAGRRRDEVSLVAGAMAGVGLLSIHAAVSFAEGRDAGSVVADRLASLLPELFRYYREQGFADSTLSSLAQLFDAARSILAAHLPGLLLALGALFGALVVYPFGKALSPAAGDEALAVPFPRYSTPPGAAVAFVPLGLLAALAPGEAGLVAADLVIALGALFFLRGMAIIRSLLARGAIGLAGRLLVYFLVLQMPVPALVALGGLFDEFFDFRRIGLPKEGAGPGAPDA